MKKSIQLKKETLKSKDNNSNKYSNSIKKGTTSLRPQQQYSNSERNKHQRSPSKNQNKKSTALTWRHQKINPASTFPLTKSTQISNGTSPKNKQHNNKQDIKVNLNSKETEIIEGGPLINDLNSNLLQLQLLERNNGEADHLHDDTIESNTNINKSLIHNILSMFSSFKPQIDHYQLKDNTIDNQNHFLRLDLQQFTSNSNDELKHHNSIHSINSEASETQRKETYKNYFDFLFNTLEDIKTLCNKQIATPLTKGNDNDINSHTIQCDINESQLKEKSNVIEPVGNAIGDSIHSLMISSLYSNFYQEIINNIPSMHQPQIESKKRDNNISVSTVVKEDIGAKKSGLKDSKEKLPKKFRRNENMPKMLLAQQTSIAMNMSNESTIKMIENDNIDHINYFNNTNLPPMLKLPHFNKNRLEHKHTKSIQDTKVKVKKENCSII